MTASASAVAARLRRAGHQRSDGDGVEGFYVSRTVDGPAVCYRAPGPAGLYLNENDRATFLAACAATLTAAGYRVHWDKPGRFTVTRDS